MDHSDEFIQNTPGNIYGIILPPTQRYVEEIEKRIKIMAKQKNQDYG